MKITEDSPPVLTALDRPNSYIGRSVPRPNLKRLAQGRGQYVSDVTLPRMSHVAYLRSPHAHARIVSIKADAAKKAPGVTAVVTGAEAEDACELVEVAYEELPAVVDPETALDAKTPVIHASLGDNLCFERKLDAGAVDKAFAEADVVVETTFRFGRHTGVTN